MICDVFVDRQPSARLDIPSFEVLLYAEMDLASTRQPLVHPGRKGQSPTERHDAFRSGLTHDRSERERVRTRLRLITFGAVGVLGSVMPARRDRRPQYLVVRSTYQARPRYAVGRGELKDFRLWNAVCAFQVIEIAPLQSAIGIRRNQNLSGTVTQGVWIGWRARAMMLCTA
jgi:hypothetical protein